MTAVSYSLGDFRIIRTDKRGLVPDVQVLSGLLAAVVAKRHDVPASINLAVLLDQPAGSWPVYAVLHKAQIRILAADFLPVSEPVPTAERDLP